MYMYHSPFLFAMKIFLCFLGLISNCKIFPVRHFNSHDKQQKNSMAPGKQQTLLKYVSLT